MAEEVLRYESSIQHYGISDGRSRPHSAKVGRFRIFERFYPSDRDDLSDGIKNYQIVMEAVATSREEAWQQEAEAFELADQLDRAWIYACGRPLHPAYMELLFPDAPLEWTSNKTEVITNLARAEGGMTGGPMEVRSRHWLSMNVFPLRSVLVARRELSRASATTNALVDLHHSALKSRDVHAPLFLLAKGLELVRFILPGRTDTDREKVLPVHVRNAMSQSLHSLFDLSNNRFDVRHVVKDKNGPQLHQRMTAQEYNTFIADADLVIRAVVCELLSIPAFVVRRAN